MAQPPFQADVLQIEPSSGQTLTLARDPATGSMVFKDALVTGGLTLSDLANLGTIGGVLVVGRSGTGAKYTTIQSAINAVPSSSSSTNPYVILIFPGVYTENVIIEKDGISLLGYGRVVIQPSTATDTITIRASVSTFPLRCNLRSLIVLQPNDGRSCVAITGGAGSTVGSLGITLEGCLLAPTGVGSFTVYGDTVNSVVLSSCRSDGAAPTATLRFNQCASVRVSEGTHPLVQVDYNSAGTLPSVVASTYSFSFTTLGTTLVTLQGGTSVSMDGCTVGPLTVNGNRTASLVNSTVGVLVLGGTTAATLTNTPRGSVSGTGTMVETLTRGTSTFVAVDHVDVTLPVARPTNSYMVNLDAGLASIPWTTTKTTSGFTIQFAAPVSTAVLWSVQS